MNALDIRGVFGRQSATSSQVVHSNSQDLSPAKPPQLSNQQQWQHITAAEQTTLSRATKAQQSHAVATLQLDAADYELAGIFKDLNTLMPQLQQPQRAAESGPPQALPGELSASGQAAAKTATDARHRHDAPQLRRSKTRTAAA